MKWMSVGLLLAALPVFGGQKGATLAPIALYSQFQQQPPAAVLDAIRRELAEIMAPLGLQFEWRSLTATRGKEVAVELVVVTFKGRCELTHLSLHSGQAGALGWTHISDGTILPFADIDCDSIRTFLEAALMGSHPQERDELLGRAIGRVLAHELYHILANTQHHGSGGVGKAAYTVDNLLSKHFEFDEGESLALITSKVHEILAQSGEDGSR